VAIVLLVNLVRRVNRVKRVRPVDSKASASPVAIVRRVRVAVPKDRIRIAKAVRPVKVAKVVRARVVPVVKEDERVAAMAVTIVVAVDSAPISSPTSSSKSFWPIRSISITRPTP